MKTCCFFGNEKVSIRKMSKLISYLEKEIDTLINIGVDKFICCGHTEFDEICTSIVIEKKKRGDKVNLIYLLPESDKNIRNQKYRYINHVDEIIYFSSKYAFINRELINKSDICLNGVVKLFNMRDATIKFAQASGVEVINV